MIKKYLSIILISLIFLIPTLALALDVPESSLQMPKDGNDLAAMIGINAQAFIVSNVKTGQVLIDKNVNQAWPPASLTKLVTALVVVDSKTKLTKTVAMTSADQVVGGCSVGGACLRAKPGVSFTVDGLFHAALMPSDNNAANALSRSTGLTPSQFVARMNAKVQALGATNTHFNEPTGMDATNKITASDYAKIVTAAFSNSYLRQIAGLSSYALRSTNNSAYNQSIKNTDKLLADSSIQILGAKTGYLNESQYNFASLLTYNGGDELAVVVLGEQHLYSAFAETKSLAGLAEQAQALAALQNTPQVLGTSTQLSINN